MSSAGLSRSAPTIASSTRWPIVGCFACVLSCAQRASGGTQKMFSARYSSGSSRISALCPLPFEAGVPLLEGLGDVFQKDETEDDMRGRRLSAVSYSGLYVISAWRGQPRITNVKPP